MLNDSAKKYKPFFFFIVRFVLCYSFLVVLYKWFLNKYNSVVHQVDAITYGVSDVTSRLIDFLGYSSSIALHDSEASVILYVGKVAVVRVIEGCNSISVILLFVSFIVAFSGSFKRTILYSILGSILVFILNIVRIVFITIAIYHYPQFEHILHEIVFPLLIYGVVFGLWVVWVNKYSYHVG